MRVRFDFTSHIAFRAQELGIQGHRDRNSSRIGFGIGNAKCGNIDTLADECRRLGLSITGPDVVTRQWTPYQPAVFAVVVDPMGWIEVALPSKLDHLAALLSDHGATLAFTPMEDGPGYSAVVRFPDGGTAHTDGSRGDLLAAVIGAVECHVGVDDEPETEFKRAAVDVARDDVVRGDVVSLDDAKVSLAGGEE